MVAASQPVVFGERATYTKHAIGMPGGAIVPSLRDAGDRFSGDAARRTGAKWLPFAAGIARYSYDAKDVMPTTTATMAGLPGFPFSFEGVQVGRSAAIFGGSLTLAKGNAFALFADYNVEMRRYETVQTAWGGLRMNW